MKGIFYIRGNSERGDEVIAALLNKGAKNPDGLTGSNPNRIYFTCSFLDGRITRAREADMETLKAYGTELVLPETPKGHPGTWKAFCENYPLKGGECHINTYSNIDSIGDESVGRVRHSTIDRNLLSSKEEAEAFLAFMQLRALRKAWVGEWEPDWSDGSTEKAVLTHMGSRIVRVSPYTEARPISFPTNEMADGFKNCFEYLLETAKELI